MDEEKHFASNQQAQLLLALDYGHTLPANTSICRVSGAVPFIVSRPLLIHSCSSSRHRRDDLQDMLADPMYFQAVFHSLHAVKSLYQAQEELGMANESIASTLFPLIPSRTCS